MRNYKCQTAVNMGAKYLNMFSSRGKKYSFFFFKAKLKCGSAIPAFDLNAGKAEG